MITTARVVEIRRFSNSVGAVLALIAAGLWYFKTSPKAPGIGIAGGLLMVMGALTPAMLDPLERLWMRIGHGLGVINTRILLGLVFFVLVLPIGVVMRLVGADRCGSRFDKALKSYFEPAPEHLKNHRHFERPF